MKSVGLIGGIGPESTVAYYRQILARHPGPAPSILINSIDVATVLALTGARRFAELADYIAPEIERLARAGVDFVAMASNTPHVVFDELASRSPVPLLSIVETTADALRGSRRAALFGTRFTMENGFYAAPLAARGIELVVPSPEEQAYIHGIYVNELLANIFLPTTHAALLRIVDALRDRADIDAVILGGTELPLLVKEEEHAGVRVVDSTKAHVAKIVAFLECGSDSYRS